MGVAYPIAAALTLGALMNRAGNSRTPILVSLTQLFPTGTTSLDSQIPDSADASAQIISSNDVEHAQSASPCVAASGTATLPEQDSQAQNDTLFGHTPDGAASAVTPSANTDDSAQGHIGDADLFNDSGFSITDQGADVTTNLNDSGAALDRSFVAIGTSGIEGSHLIADNETFGEISHAKDRLMRLTSFTKLRNSDPQDCVAYRG